ncbi:deoxyribose-phosphate aldolase [Oricola sp.]|uniref:deoxyribose-phosphate aldolase n=1 Tax=Oricola sp. TaxID=1979950 RepID=UPI0025D2E3F2|nr:deoxyribose-phosphate aldolase [Oricola sp.]MCI5077678.1 deoxyribose-phosphate aldolase [Oricola sp.]
MPSRKEIAGRALGLIDLTNLNEDCTEDAIDALCDQAATPFGPVAAICIWPRFVAQARARLGVGNAIRIATVVNFPSGDAAVESVLEETRGAIADGADEIDLVIPYKALAAGDEAALRAMVAAIRAETEGKALLKVIVESGELKDPALISTASTVALEEGTDFIKTSTGKVAVNATPETAEIMLTALKAFGDEKRGFKPAGGIRTVAEAGDYLAIADRIMGEGWATAKTFRFGASSLLKDVLAALQGDGAVAPGADY